jgi:hypothetical protein
MNANVLRASTTVDKVLDLVQQPGSKRVRGAERAANEVLRRSVDPGDV